jgi:hypothetical protein
MLFYTCQLVVLNSSIEPSERNTPYRAKSSIASMQKLIASISKDNIKITPASYKANTLMICILLSGVSELQRNTAENHHADNHGSCHRQTPTAMKTSTTTTTAITTATTTTTTTVARHGCETCRK